MRKWLEVCSKDYCLLKISLDNLTKIIVRRSKEVLTIQLALSDKQIAELLFPDIKTYRTISRKQCEIIYYKFLDRNYHWVIKDGSIAENINSSNGTFVDGAQLKDYEIKKLTNGNIITFANQEYPRIEFCSPDQEEDSEDSQL